MRRVSSLRIRSRERIETPLIFAVSSLEAFQRIANDAFPCLPGPMHHPGLGMVPGKSQLMVMLGQDQDRDFMLLDRQVQDFLIAGQYPVEFPDRVAP